MVFEHGFDGVTQQRGVVAREWGHDQDNGLSFDLGKCLGVVRKTLESAQFAKRLVHFDTLVDSDFHPVHIDRFDAELRLFVIFA